MQKITSVEDDMEELEQSYIASRNVRDTITLQTANFLKS